MTSDTAPAERLGPDLIRLGLVLVVGIFMSMLDTTIVTVALRTLGHELDAGLSTIQWVVTGYLLALAVVIPTTGWLTERFGAKQIFVASIVLFTVASALCASAWNVQSLIGFRIVQGTAGALLMPVAQTILAQAAGPQRMGRVMTVVGVPALLAPVLGPVLGGVLVDNLSWRWLFLINVPVGVLATVLSTRMLPATPPNSSMAAFDLRGWLLLSPASALVVYGLSKAGDAGGFGPAEVWVPLAAGVVLLVSFAGYAAGVGDRALIPLRYFKDRSFAGASVVSLALGLTIFGVMLLIPLYYQQVRGESALVAGLLLAPQGLGTALAMPVAGRLTDRYGPRRVVLVGSGLIAVSTLAWTQVTDTTSYALLAAVLLVRGLGFGATMMPAMAAGYRNLPAAAAGHASSVLQILSRIGGTLGAAAVTVILTHQLTTAPGRTPADLAHAYASTFWWATAITAAGVLFGLLLPNTPARATATTDKPPSARDRL
ncbi:MDR family MFS transporter [Nocardia blacklockiae]|uniref:MDR family MFS transporter n=1 Tax=Nocardia blacklockiae TaxID=480036 RepID=UPI0018958FF8|nr:MDR family MFS transporter [Nocardia blacklockiae]MBF6171539.1 multidrug efflux MFS transporter [Nocardia blacklockiae]